MVNCDHRGMLGEAHHFYRADAGQYRKLALAWPRFSLLNPLLRSDATFNPLATTASRFSEPRLALPGEPADSDGAKQPPVPGTPYRPYSEKPALPELPYKPYGEEPAHEAPYEPYKGI